MNATTYLNSMFGASNAINRLTVMCKAKDFLHSENHFEFKFANSYAKVNGVKVNHVKFIKTDETWKVVFGRIKKVKMFGVSMPEYEVVQEYKDIWENQVKAIFEQTTGFYTSL